MGVVGLEFGHELVVADHGSAGVLAALGLGDVVLVAQSPELGELVDGDQAAAGLP